MNVGPPPLITISADDDWQEMALTWPDPRPEAIAITSSAFEAMVNELNRWRRLGRRLDREALHASADATIARWENREGA